MSLLQRLASLIAANIHELIDRYEDPETSLAHVIREMEAAIEAALDEAARAIADERLLERQLAERTRLGRTESEPARQQLTEQLRIAREAAGRMRAQIEAMFTRLIEARRRLSSLIVRRRAALTHRRLTIQCPGDSDVAHSFERLCERARQYEWEAEAMIKLCQDIPD